MEYKSSHPLVQFTKEEMELCRTENDMTNVKQLDECLDAILEWFHKQPHLVGAGIERDVLERMFLQAKGSIERTKERIENLYTLKAATPELMANRDTHNNDIDGFWKWSRTVLIPKLFDGKRITIMTFNDHDLKDFEYPMLYKIGFMMGDFRLKHDYSIGDYYIVDLANTTFSHLTKVSPFMMKKAETIFQGGYGSRICGIHILNAPPFADKLLFLVKQAIKPKITDRIQIHHSYEDLQQAIPKEYLPSDYGGYQKSMEDLADMWRQEFRSMDTRRFFLESEKLKADESKRIGGSSQVNQLAGSFRKLDFD